MLQKKDEGLNDFKHPVMMQIIEILDNDCASCPVMNMKKKEFRYSRAHEYCSKSCPSGREMQRLNAKIDTNQKVQTEGTHEFREVISNAKIIG